MARDELRLKRIEAELDEAKLVALICALPVNVLLISGYWPVVGASLALVTREGRVALLVPEDERFLAELAGKEEIDTFQPGSLQTMRTILGAVREPLRRLLAKLGITGGRIGYEAGDGFQPAPYVSCHFYGASLPALLADILPRSERVAADDLLRGLRALKTPQEIARIRTACRIAGRAYHEGARRLEPGLKESEVAAQFGQPLLTEGVGWDGVRRAGGEVYCMAGPNAARSYAAYQLTSARRIEAGELALVHCNSYADGYFTDITRTYGVGPCRERQRFLLEAVLAARQAALQMIRPGVRAAQVDQAARQVLSQRGLGAQFKHSTGHGVGFAAIDHTAPPCLHPCSEAVLQEGMVFNVEPAVYLDGEYGLRHCDMVAVTANGAELLTPFHDVPASLLRAGESLSPNLA